MGLPVEVPRLAGEVRSLRQKWQRDSHLPISRRVQKAERILSERALARLYLRRAQVGTGVRVIGRPIVNNEGGSISLGDRTVYRSIVAPVELAVGPGARLSIAADSHINSGTTICALKDISIGQRVEIATHVTIYDSSFHQLYNRNALPDPEAVVIEDDVWICTKASVLAGVRVGRGAVIAAHALVRDDVEPFCVVSGVPARVVKRLDPEKFVVAGTV